METNEMAVVDGKTGLVVRGINWMRTTTDAYYPPTMAETRAATVEANKVVNAGQETAVVLQMR